MNETEPLHTPPVDENPIAETTVPTARRNPLRPVLIGVAAGLAVLALGVGGAVIADSLDGDDDPIAVASRDDSATHSSTTATATPTPSPTSSHDASDDSSDDSGHGSDDFGSDDSSHGGSDDAPVATDEYAAVSAAAIAAAGGSGTVEEVKREDDGAVAWEVDVRLDNGAKVEVELAADLSVISTRIDD